MKLFPSIPKLLARHRPVWVLPHPFPGMTLIHRLELAREVLERHDTFTVAHQGARMESCIGATMLGMPDGPEYRAQLAFARDSIQRSDLPELTKFVATEAEQLIDVATRHKTTLDLVAEYLDPLCLRYLEYFFGITDPGHGVVARWFKMTSYYYFSLYLGNPPRVEVPSLRAGKQLLAHVTSLVEQRKQAADLEGSDVLMRMLRLRRDRNPELTDREIAQRLVAFAGGSVVAPFGLALNALDILLNLGEGELAGAREAARHDQDQVVCDYVLEAARFAPMPPIVSRFCPTETTLAKGTALECHIPRGSLVVVNCVAVNRDATAIDEPEAFRPGRPEHERMLFGHSMHSCFAAHIGELLATQAAKALLKQPVFERMSGEAGKKRRGPRLDFPEGIFATSLGAKVANAE